METDLIEVTERSLDALCHIDDNSFETFSVLMLYKYLSDESLHKAADILIDRNLVMADEVKNQEQRQRIYEEYYSFDVVGQLLRLSCTVPPADTVQGLLNKKENKKDLYSDLEKAFEDIRKSRDKRISGLFIGVPADRVMKLARTFANHDVLYKILDDLGEIDLYELRGDVLGGVYEKMINASVRYADKTKAAECTPSCVTNLIAELLAHDTCGNENISIYDPVMGSGSMLLNTGARLASSARVTYAGEDVSAAAYDVARTNMIFHDIHEDSARVELGDIFLDDNFKGERFDVVIMHPTFGSRWHRDIVPSDDARFVGYGIMPPRTKADYAFMLHGLSHLNSGGVMAAIFPQGVLFRGAAEHVIRRKLIKENIIDTVILLPAGIFYGTGIPACVVVCKKDRTERDVLFIDASGEVTSERKYKLLEQKHINHIVSAYEKRENIPKYSHVATLDEIESNDYNLNVSRYVDTFEPEPDLDIAQLTREMADISRGMAANRTIILSELDKLKNTDSSITNDIAEIKNIFI